MYVTMRRYDPPSKKMVTCKGKSLILENWTPDEAFSVMVRAFQGAAARIAEERGHHEDHSNDQRK